MGKPIFKNLTRMAFSPFRERGVYQTLRSLRAVLYARRTPDERLYGSGLDTVTHVLGVVSLGAMLAFASASFAQGTQADYDRAL